MTKPVKQEKMPMNAVTVRSISTRSSGKRPPNNGRKTNLSFRKLPFQSQGQPRSRELAVDPVVEKKRRQLYDQATGSIDQVLQAVRNRKRFPLQPAFQLVAEFCRWNHPRDRLLIVSLHRDDRHRFVNYHAVNVAVYAVKLAGYLGYRTQQRIELGVAGLLHDVGTALVPDEILYKKGRLNEDEISVMRERPNFSYKILRSLGDEASYLAECAVQVHERADGSGYPRGLKADEIHEYAQIIGLMDVYEALMHSRPHRDRLTGLAVIKELFTTHKHRFRKEHLKALLNLFSVFPLHSYVRLNSGAVGKVIETYPDQPMRPRLQIVFDSQKRRVLTKRMVSLPDNPLLNVVDSVSEEELRRFSSSAG
jgi:HD-GYP domain-containing protein (c-di-GMP phosphodiesterase class II)